MFNWDSFATGSLITGFCAVAMLVEAGMLFFLSSIAIRALWRRLLALLPLGIGTFSLVVAATAWNLHQQMLSLQTGFAQGINFAIIPASVVMKARYLRMQEPIIEMQGQEIVIITLVLLVLGFIILLRARILRRESGERGLLS